MYKTTIPTQTISLGPDTIQHRRYSTHKYYERRNNLVVLVAYGSKHTTEDVFAQLGGEAQNEIYLLLQFQCNITVRCILSPNSKGTNWFVYTNMPNEKFAHQSTRYVDKKLMDFSPTEIHVQH